MCKKCGNNGCSNGNKCGSSGAQTLADIQNELAELRSTLDSVSAATRFLQCGHPIIALSDENDIEAFDPDTGEGSKCWEGWGIANGSTYKDSSGKNFVSANLIDRFQVGAGGNYSAGDTGGSDSVTLITAQLPSHNHAITDPGHYHAVTDPGHSHGGSSGPHTHTITALPHNHLEGSSGTHTHTFTASHSWQYAAGTTIVSGTQQDIAANFDLTTAAGGDHTHVIADTTVNVSASSESVGVVVASAFTGISVNSNITGISLADAGGDQAHENRPPYFAVLFVQKIG